MTDAAPNLIQGVATLLSVGSCRNTPRKKSKMHTKQSNIFASAEISGADRDVAGGLAGGLPILASAKTAVQWSFLVAACRSLACTYLARYLGRHVRLGRRSGRGPDILGNEAELYAISDSESYSGQVGN